MEKKILFPMSILFLIIVVGLGISASTLSPKPGLPPLPTPGANSLISQDKIPAVPMPTMFPSFPDNGRLPWSQVPPFQGGGESMLIPTRVGKAPQADWRYYTDENFGFSFSYPANWEVDTPGKLSSDELPSYGYLITIRNFNNVVSKIGMNPQEIKIDVWLFPKSGEFTTLEEWVSGRKTFAPGTTYSDIERTAIGDKSFLSWTATGPTVPDGSRLIVMEKQDQIVLFVAVPSNSYHISILETIVESLE